MAQRVPARLTESCSRCAIQLEAMATMPRNTHSSERALGREDTFGVSEVGNCWPVAWQTKNFGMDVLWWKTMQTPNYLCTAMLCSPARWDGNNRHQSDITTMVVHCQ